MTQCMSYKRRRGVEWIYGMQPVRTVTDGASETAYPVRSLLRVAGLMHTCLEPAGSGPRVRGSWVTEDAGTDAPRQTHVELPPARLCIKCSIRVRHITDLAGVPIMYGCSAHVAEIANHTWDTRADYSLVTMGPYLQPRSAAMSAHVYPSAAMTGSCNSSCAQPGHIGFIKRVFKPTAQ